MDWGLLLSALAVGRDFNAPCPSDSGDVQRLDERCRVMDITALSTRSGYRLIN